MEGWCLHGQCVRDFSQQGFSDVTRISTSAAADGGLLEREGERRTGKQTERKNNNHQWLPSLIIHIIPLSLPKTHLHKSKKAIHHWRLNCTPAEDYRTSQRGSAEVKEKETAQDKEATTYHREVLIIPWPAQIGTISFSACQFDRGAVSHSLLSKSVYLSYTFSPDAWIQKLGQSKNHPFTRACRESYLCIFFRLTDIL